MSGDTYTDLSALFLALQMLIKADHLTVTQVQSGIALLLCIQTDLMSRSYTLHLPRYFIFWPHGGSRNKLLKLIHMIIHSVTFLSTMNYKYSLSIDLYQLQREISVCLAAKCSAIFTSLPLILSGGVQVQQSTDGKLNIKLCKIEGLQIQMLTVSRSSL